MLKSPKPLTQATITTKTKTKIYSKAPTKKKKTQTVWHAHKRKPEDDPTDNNSSSPSSPESTHALQKKHAKQSVVNNVNIVNNEPEVVINLISGSGSDNSMLSNDEVWSLTYIITLMLMCQQGWWAGGTTPYSKPCGGPNQEGPGKWYSPDIYR